MNGIVMVGSRFFTPEELYPDHRPVAVEGVNVSELVHRYGDEKVVVVFNDIPDRQLLERLAYPFVVYTTKKPPKWLYGEGGVEVREKRKYINNILTRVVHGNKIGGGDLQYIKNNIYFTHIVLSQNLHHLYDRVPSALNILDRMASSHNQLYPEYLVALFKTNPPDNPVAIKYDKNKYWRNINGDRDKSE